MSFDLPPINQKPRTLTVCPSCRSLPRIVLSGYWLHQWGYKIGDRFLAFYAGIGAFLLKIRTEDEGENFPASSLPQSTQSVSPLNAIKYRVHPTQVRTPDGRLPKITITGAWLHMWGIKLGDKVSVTKMDDNTMRIEVAMSAALSKEIKSKKKLQGDAAFAFDALERHRANHPDLYREAPKASRQDLAPVESIEISREVVRLAGCLITLFEPFYPLPIAR
jgi:hypothetical protein